MILTGEKGFTIVEILIILIIVSILASLAAIGPEFIRNENIAKASKELLADLQGIRQDAMTTGTSANSMGFGIKFVNSQSYTIFEFNDADGDFRLAKYGIVRRDAADSTEQHCDEISE